MQSNNLVHDDINDPLIRFVKSLLKVALNDSIFELVLAKPGSFRNICHLLKFPVSH